MDKEVECLCCKECLRTAEKLNDNINLFGKNEVFPCITEHQGFQSICLDPFVLQVAWLSYKQHYENVYDGPTHKKYRHVSYRQYVRWTHGYVGKQIRVVTPSCVSVVSGNIFLYLGKKNFFNLSVSNIWISSRQPFNPKIKFVSSIDQYQRSCVAWQKLYLLVYNGRYTSEQEQTVQNFQILIEEVQHTW